MLLKKPSISRNLHGFLLGVGALLIHQSHALETDSLLQNFQSPPIETRPTVCWRFMDDYVSREGITADLDFMKRTCFMPRLNSTTIESRRTYEKNPYRSSLGPRASCGLDPCR